MDFVGKCLGCPVGNPIRYQGRRRAALASLLPFISRNSITDVFSEFRAKQTREHRELDAMKFERAVRRLSSPSLSWCPLSFYSRLFL